MTSWSGDELSSIGEGDEIRIASRRPDRSLRPYVRIWVVRVGDDLYVRSAYGPENGWYRRALASGEGRIRTAGMERDVTFEAPDRSLDAEVDRAYHVKYDRYGPAIVGTVVSSQAAGTTLRLVPS
jgi:hypothetical protein